ncbi:MAG TPA: sensor histidine kinase [Natronosporangium sp.]
MPTLTYPQRFADHRQRLLDWGRGLPPLAIDAVLAIGCYLTVVVMAIADEKIRWWVFVLAGANVLPLLWRRRFPFTVTLICGVFTAWLSLVDAIGQIPAAQLVATYTFAALSPPLIRLIGVIGTVIGVTISIVPHDEFLAIGPVGIMFAVAYALGTSARARRDRIAMLEERARRHAEEQAAAATRERERIARELHDILAHSMSLVVVQAEAGPVAVRSDPDKAEEVFETISTTAREALTQLRRTLGVLRSDEPAREPQPDLDALPALLERVRRAGLAASLEEVGERRPVPPALATTAYRIVQESLTNTVKHAGASQAWVRLDWRDDALRLEVRDDGRGPANGKRDGTGGGHGLVGMRERVAAAGGELTSGAGPDGTGYRVTATLPLQ